jgi:hypothetical protein
VTVRARRHTGVLAGLALSFGALALSLSLSASAGAAGGQVCMGVVVDEGSGTTLAVSGVNVDPGTTNDLQAMSAAGEAPTQNDSGLVCQINNYPADGLSNCLAAKKGQFFYWSYWQGDPVTNTWTYASVGPASHDVSAGQAYVEGWRYQDPGPDNPTAPPPRISPAAAFSDTCQSTTTTTTTSGGGGGSSGGGSGSGTTVPSSAPTAAPTTQPVTAPAAGTVSPHAGNSGHAGTTTTNPKGSSGNSPSTSEASSTTTSSTARSTVTLPKTGTSPSKLAAADTASHGQSGGDPALPIVIVAVLIGLLGGVAWFRWRRRPAEE